MFYMMRNIEDYGESVLNLFPLRSEMIPKYFRLDTTSLVDLLIDVGNGFFRTNGNLLYFQDGLWDDFFKTDMNVSRKLDIIPSYD